MSKTGRAFSTLEPGNFVTHPTEECKSPKSPIQLQVSTVALPLSPANELPRLRNKAAAKIFDITTTNL
jgi:hypothetical protein